MLLFRSMGCGQKGIFLVILFFSHILTKAQLNPVAHPLKESPYSFSYWHSEAAAGTFPENMLLLQFASESDPKIEDEPMAIWPCVYNAESRSRFLGLNNDGIGFLNTSGVLDESEVCQGKTNTGLRTGVAIIAIDTRNQEDIELRWKIRLMQQGAGLPVPREYRIVAQYRIDSTANWTDLSVTTLYSSLGKVTGDVSNYITTLPAICNNQPYIQLRWKYYQHNGNNGGSRPLLALDDIRVMGSIPDQIKEPGMILSQNNLPVIGCVAGKHHADAFFEIEGYQLTEPLSLKAPDFFKIRSEGMGVFSDSLIIMPENGYLNQQKIHVSYNCDEVRENSALLTIKSPEIGTKSIRLNGEVYPQLYINEIMASNFNVIEDNVTKEFNDWIEIYNPNPFEISLSEYRLTDDETKLSKYIFPDRNLPNKIPPMGYKLLWANDDSTNLINHLNFSLSIYGEKLLLIGKDGITIIDSLSFGEQTTNIPFGRLPDGTENLQFLETPTPAATNNISEIARAKSSPPTFSVPGGFYNSIIDLSLDAPAQNATIYYTLDGSDPDPENVNGKTYSYVNLYPRDPGQVVGPFIEKSFKTFEYNSNLLIEPGYRKPERITGINTQFTYGTAWIPTDYFNDAVVVRAMSVEPGKLPSDIKTQTYFINYENTFKGKLPVISINIQEDRLFDYYNGIYVAGTDFVEWRIRNDSSGVNGGRPANYTRKGLEWEVPANIEIYENTINTVNQSIGVRIHGGFSRAQKIKSLRLYPRSFYGNDQLSYSFFKTLPYAEYKRIILRNSGNDALRTYFKDAMIHRLFDHLNLDNQQYAPFNIYINGEYWGVLNARERLDINYFIRKYGMPDERIDIIENNRILVNGKPDAYVALSEFIGSKNLSDSTTYTELNTMMDTDNFISHFISKIYTASTDWPNNNIKCWRYQTERYDSRAPYGLDGKWRWMQYDFDSGFEINRINHNTVAWALDPDGNGKGPLATFLFRNLMKSKFFKESFIITTCDQLNSAYKRERVIYVIDSIYDLLKDDYPYHIARWRDPATLNFWMSNIENLRKFGRERPEILRNIIRNEFSLSTSDIVTLTVDDISKGHIKINTIEVDEALPGVSETVYPWYGEYFRNMPVRLVPIPKEGYKLWYWETKDSLNYSDTLVFNLTENTIIKAYFQPDTAFKYTPEPFKLAGCPYLFEEWNDNAEQGTYPPNMLFINAKFPDSGPNGAVSTYLDSIEYDLSSRTRINGLDDEGLSFTNATESNTNYQATRIGGAIVAINTEDVKKVELTWTGGTIKPASKEYNIRLQYRIGQSGPFKDVLDANNKPVEYRRNDIPGHDSVIGPIELPSDAIGKPGVQLLWRYYYTNKQNNPATDSRDQLRIDNIVIGQKAISGIESTGPFSANLIGATNGVNYQWFRCEKGFPLPIEGANNQLLEIRQAGEYALSIEFDGCSDTSSCEYFFVKEYKTLTPGSNMIIYPNPATSVVNVQFDGNISNATVSLLDITGRTLQTRYINRDNNIEFGIKGLPAGHYTIISESDEGLKGLSSFIKL